jgi:hypothetical protein
MSTITAMPVFPDPDWVPSPLYRLTLDQYEAMVDRVPSWQTTDST